MCVTFCFENPFPPAKKKKKIHFFFFWNLRIIDDLRPYVSVNEFDKTEESLRKQLVN